MMLSHYNDNNNNNNNNDGNAYPELFFQRNLMFICSIEVVK